MAKRGVSQAHVIELEVELRLTKERLVELKDERDKEREVFLRQLQGLQEALVAKESPNVYYDRKHQQAIEDMTPAEEAAMLKRQAETVAMRRYVAEIEGDTWKDADDMISTLQRAVGPPELSPLTESSES